VATNHKLTEAAHDAANGERVHGAAENLREQAERCRRLSSSALDRRTLDSLEAMAREYDERAARMDGTD